VEECFGCGERARMAYDLQRGTRHLGDQQEMVLASKRIIIRRFDPERPLSMALPEGPQATEADYGPDLDTPIEGGHMGDGITG
jgi:hypothetical protein